MERYDVSEPERFAAMVSDAAAGIGAEITRAGMVIARVVPAGDRQLTGGQEFIRRLERLHHGLPVELMGGDAAADIRAMRDEEW